VVIRKADYDKLADYLKQAINAAWSQLRRGRKIGWKITSVGHAIFLLTVENEYEASTVSEEQKLSAILGGGASPRSKRGLKRTLATTRSSIL
jgi:hypothetical protein